MKELGYLANKGFLYEGLSQWCWIVCTCSTYQTNINHLAVRYVAKNMSSNRIRKSIMKVKETVYFILEF